MLFVGMINTYGRSEEDYNPSANPFPRIYVKGRADGISREASPVYEKNGVRMACPWIISASAGLHTFRGDYSCAGKFLGTVSPQWSIGVGKWLGTWIGLKAEFTKSRTDGYTRFPEAHYGYGQHFYTEEGVFYRKMQTKWIDFGAGVMIDFSRIFGNSDDKMTYRITGELGADAMSHLGFGGGVGSDNELAAHAILQYSRFLTHEKSLSADVALRGVFYNTKQDIVDAGASRICCNLGVSVGLTWYIGKTRPSQARKYVSDFNMTRMPSIDDESDSPIYVPITDDENDERSVCFYIAYPENIDNMTVDEMVSYGLLVDDSEGDINSHSGLRYLYSHYGKEKDEMLVSFSDIYAALHGNGGYISRYSDASMVEKLKKTLSKGIVTHIEIYHASGAQQLGDCYTAATVKWLKSTSALADANALIYVDNKFMHVDKESDDQVDKKRCVKVRLQVVY